MTSKTPPKTYGPGEHLKLDKIEPTDEKVYWSRRKIIRAAAFTGVFGATAGVWGRRAWSQIDNRKKILQPGVQRPEIAKLFPFKRHDKFNLPDDKLTHALDAGTHNNFYEFLPGKGGPVWRDIDKFEVDPWKVEITGECNKPQTLDLDDLFTKFSHEERVYRHRCVETWAMVVPWSGFPLKKLLERVEPNANAKYVRFITANRPEQMPGMAWSTRNKVGYPWPYYEGLRIEEAMNDLALVGMGIYGKPLSKQHGAPLRLVIPWKYGYKSIKSIVKIELIKDEPTTFWSDASNGQYRHEYGFLSNINPNIPHPRWSQAREYMLGDKAMRRVPTTIYNGYGEYVAKLYPNEPTEPQKRLRFGEIAR